MRGNDETMSRIQHRHSERHATSFPRTRESRGGWEGRRLEPGFEGLKDWGVLRVDCPYVVPMSFLHERREPR